MTTIIHKSGIGVPSDEKLDTAELAIDTSNGNLYTKLSDGSIAHINDGSGSGGGVEEAPVDGKQYARQDAGWSEITSTGGSSLWEQNGDDIYYDAGNVGIGDISPSVPLSVQNGDSEGTVAEFYGSTGGKTRPLSLISGTVNSWSGAEWDFNIASGGGEFAFSNLNGELMRIDSNGNVGIGTDNPANNGLTIEKSGTARLRLGQQGVRSWDLEARDSDFRINSASTLTEVMRLTDTGEVGIGGTPGTRTAGEYLEQAKTQIEGWKAEVKKRTAEQPEASTQEITLEVTDGDFGVFPTAEALAESMAERAIGGGNAKLQVAGDGYFSDKLLVGQAIQSPNTVGVSLNDNGNISAKRSGAVVGIFNRAASTGTIADFRYNDATVGSIGVSSGNAYFATTEFGIKPTNVGLVSTDTTGAAQVGVHDIGGKDYPWKDAHFSGTVYANGSPLTRATDLIETLSTLRNATKDETTLEGLRDAIGNAVGGLIEEFENQIATMPAPEEA